jgi:hypothetical protein
MKLPFRILIGLALALAASAGVLAAPAIVPTALSVTPAGALPGDTVTLTVAVINSAATGNDFSVSDTIQGTVTFRHRLTGFTFSASRTFTTTAAVPSAGGAGAFTVAYQIPTQVTQAGAYDGTITLTGTTSGGTASGSATSLNVLSVSGRPDFQITSLNYSSGTSYVGGDVIPMSLTFTNNPSTNGVTNVPYVPGQTGFSTFVRIQVVLSSNPTYGDADDFQLTILDVSAASIAQTTADSAGNRVVLADGLQHTFNWNQVLPGNFSGSYYVLAKIDSLNAVDENDPSALTVNGNNIWGGNTLNPTGTLINLIPSTFGTNFLASHGWTDEVPPRLPLLQMSTATGYSDNPSMSSDSRYMTFASDATDLLAQPLDTNGVRDIFLYDSQTHTVRRINLSQQGVQANGPSNNPVISADGRDVAFASEAGNLILGDNNGFSDIFVVNTLNGLIARVSVTTAGDQANNPSFKPAISQTGRYVVFQSTATNLVTPNTSPGVSHIYLHDRDVSNSTVFDSPGNTSTVLIDVTAGGVAGNGPSIQPAISPDGQYVAFTSDATDLDPNNADTNGRRDVFVRKVSGSGIGTTRVSVANGSHAEANNDSQTPSLSADGHYVAFASLASNLVVGDNNGVSDIFVYDTTSTVAAPVVTRMSVSKAGVEGYDPSSLNFQLGSINPTISADGRYVAFASLAANLSRGDRVGQYQGDGATATATVAGGSVTAVNVVSGGTKYSQVSPPGVIIIGGGGSGAQASAVVSALGVITSYVVTSGGSGYTTPPTVVIASDNNDAVDVFVHDRLATGAGTIDAPGNIDTVIVSVNPYGYQTTGLLGVPSTAASNIYPVISANGRYVAFPSDAENTAGLAFFGNNLHPLDSNGLRDVFLYDRRINALPNNPVAPTVVITSPGTGTSKIVNTTIPITASATTTIGVVSSVQFFINGSSVGTSTVFPYTQSWTPTAVGTYVLSALVTDSFGNLGVSSNVTITVRASPSIGITAPSDGAVLPLSSTNIPATTLLSASAGASNPNGAISQVQFYANGTAIGSPVFAPPYQTTWTMPAVGTYTITAEATETITVNSVVVDTVRSTSAAVTVTVVAAGGNGGVVPTVTLTPPPAEVSAQSTVALSASASPGNGQTTITLVEFLVNGVVIGSDATTPYTADWTPTTPGTYVVTARATDNLGGRSTSTASTVLVNGTISIAVISPAPNTVLTVNTPQVVSAQANMSTGTVVSVQFFANGTSIGSTTTFPYVVSWTPTTPGTYSITAVATDNLGSKLTSPANLVTVSSGTAPAISLSSPANGATFTAGQPQILVANASAGSGTITNVQFFANGVALGSDPTFPYNFTWTPAGTGAVALTATATDSLGNQTTSAVVNVTVAGQSASAPTVAITSPVGGASLPVGVASIITANAADSDGTIASVEFFANGVSLGVKTAFPFNATFTPSVPGNYVLTARATDNGGNIATSAAVTVNVSGGSAPSVSLTAPANGTSVGVNTPQTITASATSPSGVITSVQFFVNGVSLLIDTSFPYSAPWTPTALGTYSLTARATDNLGNITDSAPIVITAAASAPPTVSVTNPVTGSSYTVGTALNLSADAVDPDGTVASVQFFVNGVVQGSAVTTAPYRTTWTAASAGVYLITALATDNTGNVTTSAAVTVTIGSNAAPTITLTSPSAGSYALGNQVLIAASAADSDGSIANVQFFANGLSIGTVTTAPFNFSWRPTVAGTYRLTAIATDNVGNSTTSAPVTITVTAAGAPSATITNPVAGSAFLTGNTIPITATTSGGNGPIAQVQFFVNGVSLSTDSTSPYTATWTPAAPGTYNLLAVATDSAGISSNATPITILITGNQPPSVAITNPTSGTSVNAGTIVNLVASASDVDGTVASVRFLANGNAVGTAATASPFSTSWTPSAAGTYSVIAQATDNSGNVTNSAAITIVVSGNTAPTIAIVTPSSGSIARTGAPTTLVANASDIDGTIASVQFFANGSAVGTAVTAVSAQGGYRTQWTPTAEGLYRLTAVTIDNAGAATTSATVTVLAFSAASGATDNVYVGTYSGSGEIGKFALISVRGRTAAFIGYSTTATPKTYFFPGLAVEGGGSFSLADSLGRTVISGNINDTGVSGSLDSNRAIFIGPVVFPSGNSSVPAGYYTGNLTGRASSNIAAIVGADGSIMFYAADGTFQAAGSGAVDSTGSFNVSVTGGARFTGKIDAATGFLTGSLSGNNGGAFTAATASGVSFSDGFLRNLSTRGQVGTGANILIAGFVVGGTVPKQVLVRAIGPTLSGFGVTGVLGDPQLQLYNSSGALVIANNNWGGAGDVINASNAVGAFPLSSGSLDAVVLASLAPGAYTAQVSGVGGGTGVALVELYDVDSLQPFSTQKVMNVATRGVVGTGQGQLIAGFVVSGNTAKKVLIRGVGPTLAAAPFNVGGVLTDPVLRLVRADGLVIRENDNWEMGNDAGLINDAAVRVGAFPLASGGKDSAMLINLPPGTYNAQVAGSGSTTGVALIEVYEVP